MVVDANAILVDWGRVTTAPRAVQGINERRDIMRHGLRSALTPVVTQFSIDLGAVLGGVIVTETVFNLPCLGKAVLDANNQQNEPVIIRSSDRM
jgi:ABC-type dipeptide/oligopeptide/nickel transport system permease component